MNWSRAFLVAAAILVAGHAPAMEFCTGPIRITCVVDGDTFWLDGEKIRIADIDTPEAGGACVEERVLSAKAAGRLAELLEDGGYEVERQGKDKFGRTLAVILRDGRSLGSIMIEEELARPYRGHREQWCD